MTDLIFPPQSRRTAQSSFKYIDSTGMTRGIYTGAAETTSYGGDRLTASITLPPLLTRPATEGSVRAAVIAWLLGLKGRQNRTWIPDRSYQRRGSFAAGELHANGVFGSSSVGWSAIQGATVSVADGALRITLGGANVNSGADSTVPVTVNVPYAVRAFLRNGRGASQPSLLASDGTIVSLATPAGDGMATVSIVPAATSLTVRAFGPGSTGIQAGDFFECQYASVSRCALVDGGPNLLLHSDTPGGTSWTLTNATANANGTPAPDGFNGAFYLAETTANGGHVAQQAVTVPAAATDYTFSIYVKSINRPWCALQIVEGAGGSAITCYFNSVTGAIGATQATGANWANLRLASEAYGNGWFRVSITGRKTNAATSLTAAISAATIDGVGGYAGVTSPVALLTWRASLSASSFPTRSTQTIVAAAAASNDAAAYAYLKGLPVSTRGLLLPGDQVQIGKQMVFVAASLDSNEAGMGYLQFSPPLRYAPADNDPVIIFNPMARFIFSGQYPEWAHQPGIATTVSLDFEEACEP